MVILEPCVHVFFKIFNLLFFLKQKTAYEMRISDWSSDVCSSDLADDPLDLVAGADGNGRFGHDHGEAIECSGDLARCVVDIGQVGVAIAAAAGSADGDEHDVGSAHGFGRLGGEGEIADRKSTRLNSSH